MPTRTQQPQTLSNQASQAIARLMLANHCLQPPRSWQAGCTKVAEVASGYMRQVSISHLIRMIMQPSSDCCPYQELGGHYSSRNGPSLGHFCLEGQHAILTEADAHHECCFAFPAFRTSLDSPSGTTGIPRNTHSTKFQNLSYPIKKLTYEEGRAETSAWAW